MNVALFMSFIGIATFTIGFCLNDILDALFGDYPHDSLTELSKIKIQESKN